MKTAKTKLQGKTQKPAQELFGFSRTNYLLFFAGLVVIILGYFAMAQPPVNGFMTLTLAPVLLIIGYCVLVPWALFWKPKPRKNS
ncbi:MAG TPA: hypothetical protein PLG50_01925 [bacterium]|nr:hypothetical protein [bacterium]HQG44400.1 hypothetical protein [bacterium]HQI47378.1 hypothetical protein [bacterium]HQJ63020.1 hypothetical protein [bacterium]